MDSLKQRFLDDVRSVWKSRDFGIFHAAMDGRKVVLGGIDLQIVKRLAIAR